MQKSNLWLRAMLLTGLLGPGLAGAETPAQDWPKMAAYRSANAQLGPPASDEARVVFMGDSITEFWDKPRQAMFANKAYVNRGISGQTSPQMLLRFRQDVIELRPRVVVILAGTNDIAGNTGPISVETVAGHIQSMAELARVHGMRVLLCSVLPASSFYWNPELKPAASILKLNEILKRQAAQMGLSYVDFHTPMADAAQGLDKAYSGDGVHPNEAGYKLMAELLVPAINAALRADN